MVARLSCSSNMLEGDTGYDDVIMLIYKFCMSGNSVKFLQKKKIITVFM
jgi:hypothetical protein